MIGPTSSNSLAFMNPLARLAIPEISERIHQILDGPSASEKEAQEKAASLISLPELRGDSLLEDLPRLMALHEVTGAHDGAVCAMLSIHYNLCMGTVRSLGNRSSPYVQQLYTLLNEGRAMGVYLATEVAYGNNLVSMETEARYLPERGVFILNSPTCRSYKFMPNTARGPLPKIAVVMAKLIVDDKNYGIVPFLFSLDVHGQLRDGVQISTLGHKPGFPLDNAITSFSNVELPFEALLAGTILTLTREGSVTFHEGKAHTRFLMAINRVQTGKLCLSKAAIGSAKSALHITKSYAHNRVTFGDFGLVPIIRYHVFRDKLVQDAVSIAVHSLWLDILARGLSGELAAKGAELPEQLINEIAVAKAMSSWCAQETVIRCRERCGAQGLFSINRIVDYYLSINGVITAEGDNQVIMMKAGRYLLSAKPLPSSASLPATLAPWLEPIKQYYLWSIAEYRQLTVETPPAERSLIRNRRGHMLLRIARLFAVQTAVASIAQHIDDHPLMELTLELFLLSRLNALCPKLMIRRIISADQAAQMEARRKDLVQQKGELLFGLVDHFEVEQARVCTPISSGDFIEWYAAQHHGSEGVRR